MYSAAAAAAGVPACRPSRAGSASQATWAFRRSTETAEMERSARNTVRMNNARAPFFAFSMYRSSRDISKLDESYTSNPKSEISDWTWHHIQSNLRYRISDLRCRIRPILDSFLTCYFRSSRGQRNQRYDIGS